MTTAAKTVFKLLAILSIFSIQALGLVDKGLRSSDFASNKAWQSAVLELRETARNALGRQPATALSSASKEIYFFEDDNGSDESQQSFLASDLSKDGELKFIVGAGEEAPVRGWQMLKKMFDFHGLSNIKKVTGVWTYGTNLEMFLDKFKELTGKPLNKSSIKFNEKPSQELENIYKEAAKATWTAQQIAKYGFTEIENVNVFYTRYYIDDKNDPLCCGWQEDYDIEATFVPSK
jgi:hypothetical protein